MASLNTFKVENITKIENKKVQMGSTIRQLGYNNNNNNNNNNGVLLIVTVLYYELMVFY